MLVGTGRHNLLVASRREAQTIVRHYWSLGTYVKADPHHQLFVLIPLALAWVPC